MADLVRLLQGAAGELPGGSLASAVIEEFPAVQRQRAQQVVDVVVSDLAEDESTVWDRLRRDNRLIQLVWEAMRTAALADEEAKISALGRVAADGVRDDAKIDESRYLVGVLAELQPIHIRTLLLLEERGEDQLHTSSELAVGSGIAHAINSDLLGLGLAITVGMSFGGVQERIQISPFGLEVLEMLRQNGLPGP